MKIGTMEMENRIAMAPMSLGYESEDGKMNEKLTQYWEARAKGGAGLIIVDAVTVDKSAPYLGNTLGLFDDDQVPSFKEFVDKIHSYGTKVIPQITHPGPESISGFFGVPPVGPSTYPNSLGLMVRELSIAEIQEIIEKYGDAAKRAREAGCDGIELHCAHAYMLAGAFLSPLRNKRTDIYGGDLDNRARFVLEVIRNIKLKAGENFPIVLRISGSEVLPEGNDLEDMLYLVPKLIEAGIDAFEVSGGTQYELPWRIIPCHSEKAGVNVHEAAAIKKVSTVPVLIVGKINDARQAEHILENGYADAVVMGRALLSDPELPNKSKKGKFEDIAPCAGCGLGCIGEQSSRKPASCVINPALGREKEMEIIPTDQKKKVVVVGGGVAGLEAARVAAIRGHEVVLLEKQGKLGGQLNLAAIPPFKQDVSKWAVYLSTQVYKEGVEVRLNTEATEELIESLYPDVVLIASGAKPSTPPIKGIDNEKVNVGWDILTNKTYIPSGNVVVIGGGMVGCEVAETLLHNARGKMTVTIVEALEDIAMDDIPNNKIPMLNRLMANGVELHTSSTVKEITSEEVIIERNGTQESLQGFDHILLACGAKSVDTLSENLKNKIPQVHIIGDAKSPQKALEAIREGFEIARVI